MVVAMSQFTDDDLGAFERFALLQADRRHPDHPHRVIASKIKRGEWCEELGVYMEMSNAEGSFLQVQTECLPTP